jgi:hypothetical protein
MGERFPGSKNGLYPKFRKKLFYREIYATMLSLKGASQGMAPFGDSRKANRSNNIHIQPLKTTPMLEQVINFSLIPCDTATSQIVISEELRNRFNQMHPNIVKYFRDSKP